MRILQKCYQRDSGCCQRTCLITPVIGIFNAAANNDAHATVNYSAILIPQTIAQGFRVEFEIDGKIYVWTASESVTLESGKNIS